MQSFKDKRVFVTGGTKGIGLAISRAFAKRGATVAINGRSPLELDQSEHGISYFYRFDISNYSDVTHNISKLMEELGGVDILINNAGLTRDTLFMRMSEENWDDVINTNLKGAFNVTKALTKQFMKNRSGSIINISSIVGQTGNAGQANYAASKAGIIGLTKSLAIEFAPRGIRVNAITPGFIETRMTDSLPQDIKETFLNKIPLKTFGKPEDIAETAVFLASDSAGYITGQVIGVNGGLLM